METRARDLDRELHQDFDNPADDLETKAVSKQSMSLLPHKEKIRTDLQPFRQETEPFAKIWCVKMEDDTPDE